MTSTCALKWSCSLRLNPVQQDQGVWQSYGLIKEILPPGNEQAGKTCSQISSDSSCWPAAENDDGPGQTEEHHSTLANNIQPVDFCPEFQVAHVQVGDQLKIRQ